MALRIELFTTDAQAAEAAAFNRRMQAHDQTEYVLYEQPPYMEPDDAPIRNRFYVVRDEDAVRGSLLLAAFPGSFGSGEDADVINCREPISEAIIDSRFALVALRLLKFMEKQGPYLFALGMGGEDRPFPRLLKSAGWTLQPVPFLFRVARAGAFLRELRMLRTSPVRRILSRVAAITGAGKLGVTALQFRSATAALSASGLTVAPITAWEGWVDELWQQCRRDISFGVSRDLRTVRDLYPLDERVHGYCVRRGGKPIGWMAAQTTQMNDHKYFGSLRVSTILDGIALPGDMRSVVSLVSRSLIREGADLLVTNQSHESWLEAFRGSGYLSGPSNYILALSKGLAAAVSAQPNGLARMQFTRGDSDGRCHL
jgi:hypothetical protein